MTIEQYARAIAEAVRDACWESYVGTKIGPDLDAAIASVPAFDVQALRGQIEGEVWEARKRVEAALSAEIVELRAQIDAARAEEREAIIQWINTVHPWLRRLMDEISRGYHNMTDEARARSGARGE